MWTCRGMRRRAGQGGGGLQDWPKGGERCKCFVLALAFAFALQASPSSAAQSMTKKKPLLMSYDKCGIGSGKLKCATTRKQKAKKSILMCHRGVMIE